MFLGKSYEFVIAAARHNFILAAVSADGTLVPVWNAFDRRYSQEGYFFARSLHRTIASE